MDRNVAIPCAVLYRNESGWSSIMCTICNEWPEQYTDLRISGERQVAQWNSVYTKVIRSGDCTGRVTLEPWGRMDCALFKHFPSLHLGTSRAWRKGLFLPVSSCGDSSTSQTPVKTHVNCAPVDNCLIPTDGPWTPHSVILGIHAPNRQLPLTVGITREA